MNPAEVKDDEVLKKEIEESETPPNEESSLSPHNAEPSITYTSDLSEQTSEGAPSPLLSDELPQFNEHSISPEVECEPKNPETTETPPEQELEAHHLQSQIPEASPTLQFPQYGTVEPQRRPKSQMIVLTGIHSRNMSNSSQQKHERSMTVVLKPPSRRKHVFSTMSSKPTGSLTARDSTSTSTSTDIREDIRTDRNTNITTDMNSDANFSGRDNTLDNEEAQADEQMQSTTAALPALLEPTPVKEETAFEPILTPEPTIEEESEKNSSPGQHVPVQPKVEGSETKTSPEQHVPAERLVTAQDEQHVGKHSIIFKGSVGTLDYFIGDKIPFQLTVNNLTKKATKKVQFKLTKVSSSYSFKQGADGSKERKLQSKVKAEVHKQEIALPSVSSKAPLWVGDMQFDIPRLLAPSVLHDPLSSFEIGYYLELKLKPKSCKLEFGPFNFKEQP